MNIEQYCYFDSPLGKILLAGTADTLLLLGLPEGKGKREPESHWQHNPQAFKECLAQLDEYFAGRRTKFEIKYQLQGTAFQQQVLKSVAKIPYGATESYGGIADKIKNPAAVRAVGGANATNPIPIIIPCHRVIGKDGSLTGFGGGLSAKRFLLELES